MARPPRPTNHTNHAGAPGLDQERLTLDNAGLEYVRTLSAAQREVLLSDICNELRARDNYQRTRAGQMVLVVSTCTNYEEAALAFERAEAHLTPQGTDGPEGYAERDYDRTWTQYKSNLLRAFRLGVLPTNDYMTEREIRDACVERVRAQRLTDMVREVNLTEPGMEEEADEYEQETTDWVHTLPPRLRIQFWVEVARVRRRLEDLAKRIEQQKRPPARPPGRGTRRPPRKRARARDPAVRVSTPQ